MAERKVKKLYDLIYDEEKVLEYAKLFLSDIDESPHTVKMLYLAARRKYDPEHKDKGSTCFNRRIIKYSNPNIFLNSIRKYEIPEGSYVSYKTGASYNRDALVIYFCINPRSIVKAWYKLTNRVNKATEQIMLDFSKKRAEGGERSENVKPAFPFKKIDSELKSCIHSSIAEKTYVELDIDTKEPSMVKQIVGVIQPYAHTIVCTVETRGGYHVVMRNDLLDKDGKAMIHHEFRKGKYHYDGTNFHGTKIRKSYVDVRTDPTQPVPGTYQGGFKVRMIDILEMVEQQPETT